MPATLSRLNTYDAIVDAYIQSYRPHADEEVDFFRGYPSLKEAIRYAALCLRPDGKRQDHQRRISGRVLAEGERNLQAVEREIAGCTSFSSLHQVIEREVMSIYGIGKLAAYDIASRIGFYLGHEPESVYLHAGTGDGARALALNHRRRTVEIAELPQAFQRLRPREAEDCLCIFKRELAQIAATGRT